MQKLDASELRLFAWEDVFPAHAGPVVVNAWFVAKSGMVACPPFRRQNDELLCDTIPCEQIEALADKREATIVEDNTISPSLTDPNWSLILLPADTPPRLVAREKDRVHVAEVTTSKPERQRRRVFYAPRARVRSLMFRFALHYYEEACETIGSNLYRAANNATRSVSCRPAFPHPYLLLAGLTARLQPGDKDFREAMLQLGRDAWAHLLRQKPPEYLLKDGTTPNWADVVDKLVVFETMRNARSAPSDEHLALCRESLESLKCLGWPLALLDHAWRGWQAVARTCRRQRRYDSAHVPGEIALTLAKWIYEARPSPLNAFSLAISFEAAGELRNAAIHAEIGLSSVRELQLPGWPERCAKADALRIWGRAVFLGYAQQGHNDAYDLLRRARDEFDLLHAEDDSLNKRLTKDRLAQCSLLMAILLTQADVLTPDAQELRNRSIGLYLDLIASGNATASHHLLICDGYILAGNYILAAHHLEQYYGLRGNTKAWNRRRVLIARFAGKNLGIQKLARLVCLSENRDAGPQEREVETLEPEFRKEMVPVG